MKIKIIRDDFQQIFWWHFNLSDDDLILAYANVHVAGAIRATGFNKTSEDISNHNFNLR